MPRRRQSEADIGSLDNDSGKWVREYQLNPPMSAEEISGFCPYLESVLGSEIRYEYSSEQKETCCRFSLVGQLRSTAASVKIELSFRMPWTGRMQSCAAEISATAGCQTADIPADERGNIFTWIDHQISAARCSQTAAGEFFTLIERFVASPRGLLNKRVRVLDNVIALPTVFYENGQTPVGAIKCTVRSLSGTLAGDDMLSTMNRAMDAVILALGAQETWRGRDRGIPDACKGPRVLPGRVLSLRRIYGQGFQPGSSMPGLYQQSDANTSRLAELAGILKRIPPDDRAVWAALAAYRDGAESFRQSRALSVVAYMAALAALCTAKECPGEATCSKCGVLRFPHYMVGERKAIEALVLEAHKNASEETRTELSRIIAQAHRAVRSQYVHTAIPELETGRSGDLVHGLIRPQPTKKLLRELNWHATLECFPRIARRTILWKMAQQSGKRISEDLWGLEADLTKEICSTMAVRLTPGEDWLYLTGYR